MPQTTAKLVGGTAATTGARTILAAALLPILLLAAPRTARADDAATHYNLALQLKREGKVVEAIGECEKAISLRSDYASAHLTLGNLWRAQGNYQKAADEFEITVKLQPKDSTSHANLGAVLRSYEKVVVPEMNLGQLALLLRAKYLVDAESYNQVRGLPFKAAQLADVLSAAIGALDEEDHR